MIYDKYKLKRWIKEIQTRYRLDLKYFKFIKIFKEIVF